MDFIRVGVTLFAASQIESVSVGRNDGDDEDGSAKERPWRLTIQVPENSMWWNYKKRESAVKVFRKILAALKRQGHNVGRPISVGTLDD